MSKGRPTGEQTGIAQRIAALTGESPDHVAEKLRNLASDDDAAREIEGIMHEADDSEVPEGWPRLTVGEMVQLKGYWFAVAGLDDQNRLVLVPRGPSSSLVRRVSGRGKKKRRR